MVACLPPCRQEALLVRLLLCLDMSWAVKVGYLLHDEGHSSSATVAVQEELRCLAIPLQEVRVSSSV